MLQPQLCVRRFSRSAVCRKCVSHTVNCNAGGVKQYSVKINKFGVKILPREHIFPVVAVEFGMFCHSGFNTLFCNINCDVYMLILALIFAVIGNGLFFSSSAYIFNIYFKPCYIANRHNIVPFKLFVLSIIYLFMIVKRQWDCHNFLNYFLP